MHSQRNEHARLRVKHIVAREATGSPCYAHALNLPGLRFWQLTRYPHLVFYVERPEHIDVWRVLHGTWDIEQWMVEIDDL